MGNVVEGAASSVAVSSGSSVSRSALLELVSEAWLTEAFSA